MTTDSASLTFRAEADLLVELEQLASATDRSRSWHMEQALKQYLDSQSWQIAHIRKGLGDLEAGRTIDHEVVALWLESWGTDQEGDPPA